MLAILSPAKTLDYESAAQTQLATTPQMLESSNELIEVLQTYSQNDIASLMKISEKLAGLNYDRFQNFHNNPAKQALLAFKGDVYQGFDLTTYSESDFLVAQKHLRILSGLYGLLRPLDLIQPYRLEMGTKLKTPKGKNLYDFWGAQISMALNDALEQQGDDVLVNLASNEYFRAVDRQHLKAQIITPTFKDLKNGKYKIIAFYAKRARGAMADFMIREQLTHWSDLKQFSSDGYYFSPQHSTQSELVFLRDHI